MIITKYGPSFFKLTVGDKTVAINPVSKDSKLKTTKFGADITLVQGNYDDMNGTEFTEFKDRKPFVINTPGEYEISDIFIKGFGVSGKYRDEERITTMFTILMDGINMAFFGPISQKEMDNDTFEELSACDIFFLPIGGGDMFTADEALKFVKQFSPKAIVPVFYDKSSLTDFVSAVGKDGVKEEDKLTIKAKDLSEDSLEVFALKDMSK